MTPLLPTLCLTLAAAGGPPNAQGSLGARAAAPAADPAAESAIELVRRTGAVDRRALADASPELFTREGVVLVRWTGADRPAPEAARADRASLVLVSGDRLYGRVVRGEVDDLVLALAGGVELRLTIDELDRIVFDERVPASWTAPLVPAEEGDRLYRVQGAALDRLDGTVEELTDEGVRFHGVLGSRVLPWSEVAALFVESLGDAEPPAAAPEGPRVVVDLADGGRLRGELRSLDADACLLRTPRADLRLPTSVIDDVALDDGTVAFLSGLAPSESTDGAPFGDDLGMRWPHRLDRSVTGGRLRAGGHVFGRGIGVHAPSRITWALDGGWRRLLGSVAVDDEVLFLSSHGSVVFRVVVDGEPRWESPILHGGDPPLELPDLDLTGAAELTLEVDASTDFFVADRADWLTMLLVRE